mmetsp:Transcript_18641/g.26416  ORF Transcript_18641/g.26416 Transcript_18641/m.26416 type:complete len:111 (-) Transcript_18641:319-651(-)
MGVCNCSCYKHRTRARGSASDCFITLASLRFDTRWIGSSCADSNESYNYLKDQAIANDVHAESFNISKRRLLSVHISVARIRTNSIFKRPTSARTATTSYACVGGVSAVS